MEFVNKITGFFKKDVKDAVFGFKDDVFNFASELEEEAVKMGFEVCIDVFKLVCSTQTPYPVVKLELPFLGLGSFTVKLDNRNPQKMKKILDEWDKKPPVTKSEVAKFFSDLKPLAFRMDIG